MILFLLEKCHTVSFIREAYIKGFTVACNCKIFQYEEQARHDATSLHNTSVGLRKQEFLTFIILTEVSSPGEIENPFSSGKGYSEGK